MVKQFGIFHIHRKIDKWWIIMRYYDLIIHPRSNFTEQKRGDFKQDANSKLVAPKVTHTTVRAERKTKVLQFSSYLKKTDKGYEPGGMPKNGTYDPGALDINFTVNETDYSAFTAAWITIRGLDITTLSQASKLQGRYVRLLAGMGNGLPLSKPEQAGLILQGQILSSYGNWEGTDAYLEIFVTPYIIQDEKKNLDFQLVGDKGKPLKDTIDKALKANFGNYLINYNTKHNPLLQDDARGHYTTLDSFTNAMKKQWKNLTGVDLSITSHGQQFYISDITTPGNVKTIAFEDLIGQPTWNGYGNISFCTPIRADIIAGNVIKLPEGVWGNANPNTSNGVVPLPKNRSLFSGKFFIQSICHTGQFRSSDGRQWMSSFVASPVFEKSP